MRRFSHTQDDPRRRPSDAGPAAPGAALKAAPEAAPAAERTAGHPAPVGLGQAATDAFKAAIPVVLGYIAIGIPCGILCSQIGIDALMAFLMSVTFYSGAGQFMIPGMWMAGQPLAAIVASVSFVNTRQVLYSAAFAPFFDKARHALTFLFAATVTDESFGVNMRCFQNGGWSTGRATLVNLFSMLSWACANAVGVLVGDVLSIPTAIAAFAMTSIFICLMATQKTDATSIMVIVVSMVGVVLCKFVGLDGPAILLGACLGVAAGMARWAVERR